MISYTVELAKLGFALKEKNCYELFGCGSQARFKRFELKLPLSSGLHLLASSLKLAHILNEEACFLFIYTIITMSLQDEGKPP